MYITIELPFEVESHQTDYEADESEHPGGDVDDKRPSPRPPPSVDLPFKVKSGDKFPSTVIQALTGINLIGIETTYM